MKKVYVGMSADLIHPRLSRLGLQEEDIGTIAGSDFDPDRARNNPRRVTKDTVREILRNIL